MSRKVSIDRKKEVRELILKEERWLKLMTYLSEYYWNWLGDKSLIWDELQVCEKEMRPTEYTDPVDGRKGICLMQFGSKEKGKIEYVISEIEPSLVVVFTETESCGDSIYWEVVIEDYCEREGFRYEKRFFREKDERRRRVAMKSKMMELKKAVEEVYPELCKRYWFYEKRFRALVEVLMDRGFVVEVRWWREGCGWRYMGTFKKWRIRRDRSNVLHYKKKVKLNELLVIEVELKN